LLIFSGCAGKEKVLTFAVGGAPSELDYWEKVVEEFQENFNVKVKLLRQPTDTDQRRQGLVIPLKSKKPDPDVFLMDVVWIAQFAASGWLTGFDYYVKRDNFDLSKFFSSVVQQADIYEGQLLALPVYVDCGLLYYREDLLERYGCSVPINWREVLECAQRVQAGERMNNPAFYGFVWQGAQYEGLVCTFIEFVYSKGGRIVDKSGRISLVSDKNIKALEFMRDLIQKYRISPPNTYTEMKEEQVRMFFENGNALFERNWPYAWKLHQSENSPIKGKIKVTVLPKFEGGSYAAALGGWHIGISRYSDKKDLAWKFLKFVLSYETQKKLVLNLGWNPGRADIYTDSRVKEKMPHIDTLKEAFGFAVARPTLPYYTRVSQILQRFVNAAIADRLTPQEALQRAEVEIERIVKTY